RGVEDDGEAVTVGLQDGGAAVPPEAGDVDERGVLVEQRRQRLGVAPVPGGHPDLGEALGGVERRVPGRDRRGLGHGGRYGKRRTRESATMAGLALPSIAVVFRVLTRAPRARGRASSTSARRRIRAPTFTGARKRTSS